MTLESESEAKETSGFQEVEIMGLTYQSNKPIPPGRDSQRQADGRLKSHSG